MLYYKMSENEGTRNQNKQKLIKIKILIWFSGSFTRFC